MFILHSFKEKFQACDWSIQSHVLPNQAFLLVTFLSDMFWRRCWITLISISGLFRQLIPYGGPAGLGWPGSCLWWPLLQSCAQIKFFVISLFFQIKWPQKWAIKPAPLTFFPSLKISPIGSYVDVDPEISNSSKLVVISKSEHFAEGHYVGGATKSCCCLHSTKVTTNGPKLQSPGTTTKIF